MRRAISVMMFGASVAFSATADARVEADSAYTKAQTFSAALRYLRVDLGYSITEKDSDAAYLLFQFKAPGNDEPTPGSIEIVEAKGEVRLYLQVPRMPEYQERVLSDGLLKKLKDEYGEPPKKVREKPKKDSGSDDAKSRKTKKKKREKKGD